MCRRPPTWLALPDGSYERLADNDALFCGETELRSDGESIALCDYHSTLHWLGIYGDDELVEVLESGKQTEERNI